MTLVRVVLAFVAYLPWMMGVSLAQSALCPTVSHVPPVTASLDNAGSLGMLALVANGGYRILPDGCYVYKRAFSLDRLNFRARFVADGGTAPKFLGITITRIVGDVHPEWVTQNASLIKVSRNPGWYRVNANGAEENLDPLLDEPTLADLPAWNKVHSEVPPSLDQFDQAIGVAWHAQVGALPAEISYTVPRLWLDAVPTLDPDHRYVISNQLISFSGAATLVPFYGEMYDRTDIFVVRFFFGSHDSIHQVVLCRTTCN